MTKKFTYSEKHAGDQLTHTEWNNLAQDVDAAVDAINNGGGGAGSGTGSSEYINLTSKGNVLLSSPKNINIEPAGDEATDTYGDISLKPGDDIEFLSEHRPLDKQDEVSLKVHNGNKKPVKLQVNASEFTLTTKDKEGSDANVLDVNINSGKNSKGYLKVRALAIDLRCEEHGGIALQPKGRDGQNNMNKIKFEHGGGDGLEFGTFNAEKTSIFTDEYRFNREGVWKMATREKLDNTKGLSGTAGVTVGNGKYDPETDDDTNHFSYKKQNDDFYDVIAEDDEQCTTKDIIKTAYAMNGGKNRHAKITNKGAIEIATNDSYTVSETSEPEDQSTAILLSTISQKVLDDVTNGVFDKEYNEGDFTTLPDVTKIYSAGGGTFVTFTKNPAPSIKIESGNELKLGGILDFGSTFNFGETDGGIEVQYKLTKKNNTKDCGVLKVVGINNSTTNELTITTANPSNGDVEDYVIPAALDPQTNPSASDLQNAYAPQAIASCSINDIIMFVNWAKGTGFGPWDAQATANKKEYQWTGNGFTQLADNLTPSPAQGE